MKRFSMQLDIVKPDKIDGTTKVEGVDYIEVPGLSARDYKLHFYTYKEIQFQFKVHFEYVNYTNSIEEAMKCIHLYFVGRQQHKFTTGEIRNGDHRIV